MGGARVPDEARFALRDGFENVWGGAEGMRHHKRINSVCVRHSAPRHDMFWLLAAADDAAEASRDILIRTPNGDTAIAAHQVVLYHRCDTLRPVIAKLRGGYARGTAPVHTDSTSPVSPTPTSGDDGNESDSDARGGEVEVDVAVCPADALAPLPAITLPVDVPAHVLKAWLYYVYCNRTGIRALVDADAVEQAWCLARALGMPRFAETYEGCVNEFAWHLLCHDRDYSDALARMVRGDGGFADAVLRHDGGAVFRANKALLQARSDFFAEAFIPGKWAADDVIELHGCDIAERTVRDVLHCLAEGLVATLGGGGASDREGGGDEDTDAQKMIVDVGPDQNAYLRVYDLVDAAQYLGVPDLAGEVEAWLQERVHHGSVCSLWNIAVNMRAEVLSARCEVFFKQEFAYVVRFPDFLNLDRALLQRALGPGDIDVTTDVACAAVTIWARANHAADLPMPDDDKAKAELKDVQPFVQDLLPPQTMLCTQTRVGMLTGGGAAWLRSLR